MRALVVRATTLYAWLAAVSVGLAAPPPSFTATPSPLPHQRPAAPWTARTHERPRGMPSPGLALVEQDRWPAEPQSPTPIVVAELGRAFQQLCGPRVTRQRAEAYARLFVDEGEAFGVDPFLLAAVAFRHSGGVPTRREGHQGGLIVVHWKEHAPFLRAKTYHYWVLKDGEWVARTRVLDKLRFTPQNLRCSAPSVYFAAALLRIYSEQCPDIDTRFGSVPHRHPVSHLIWGDSVADAGSEERLLTDRRRLIEYYLAHDPRPVGKLDALKLFSPLDGVPRKIVNGLGDIRDDGKHAHRGVDFESTRGEPVRAVADGRVFFAGAQRGHGPSRSISPERAAHYPRRRMGVGGLFVLVDHGGEIMSAYMHLDDYVVHEGETVKGGQLLGHVGRTGIKQDPAHLHFELRRRHRAIDPTPALGAAVFGRDATYLGQMIEAAQPLAWRKARHRRWLERRAAAKRRQEEQAGHAAQDSRGGGEGHRRDRR